MCLVRSNIDNKHPSPLFLDCPWDNAVCFIAVKYSDFLKCLQYLRHEGLQQLNRTKQRHSAVLIIVKRKTIQKLFGLPAPTFKTDLNKVSCSCSSNTETSAQSSYKLSSLACDNDSCKVGEGQWDTASFLSAKDHNVDSKDESRMSS